MPAAIKCPHCNAPLAEMPAGPSAKCPYCGTVFVATTLLPAPAVADPRREAALRMQAEIREGLERHRRGTRIGVIVGVGIFTIVPVVILVAALVEKSEKERRAGGSPADGSRVPAATTLAAGTLEAGKAVLVDLPETRGAGGTVGSYGITALDPGPWMVCFAGESYEQCEIRVLGVGDQEIARTERDSAVCAFPHLAPGTSRALLTCRSHPRDRQARLLAQPLPAIVPGEPLQVTIAGEMPRAAASLAVGEPGPYAIGVAGKSGLSVELFGPDEVAIATGRVSAGPLLIERRLDAGAYQVRLMRRATEEQASVSLAAARVEPRPIALGAEVAGSLSALLPLQYWAVTIDAPTRLSATAVSSVFDCRLEIRQGDGAKIAGTDRGGGNPLETVDTGAALAPGTYVVVVAEDEGREPKAGTYALVVGDAARGPANPSVTDRETYQDLLGCGCASDVDGRPGNETIRLASRVDGSATRLSNEGTATLHWLGWVLDADTQPPLRLSLDQRTAPPRMVATSAFGVGIACDGPLVVLASQNLVTGWSVAERRALWTTQLQGTYPGGSGGPGDVQIACGALAVRRGVVDVPLEDGRKVRIRTADGSIAR